jgi:hypothetical protein
MYASEYDRLLPAYCAVSVLCCLHGDCIACVVVIGVGVKTLGPMYAAIFAERKGVRRSLVAPIQARTDQRDACAAEIARRALFGGAG